MDEVIRYLGKEIVFAMPLALGKPIRLINELYRRAKEDPEINLKIISALALEKPPGSREEGQPVGESDSRGGTPPDVRIIYWTTARGRKPDNVEIYEFIIKRVPTSICPMPSRTTSVRITRTWHAIVSAWGGLMFSASWPATGRSMVG